jgi:hypothetical protein
VLRFFTSFFCHIGIKYLLLYECYDKAGDYLLINFVIDYTYSLNKIILRKI